MTPINVVHTLDNIQKRLFRERKILVVDDSEADRVSLRILLEQCGCFVTEAVSGEDAVERAAPAMFDLCFIDMKMLAMDGFECAKKIREKCPTLRAILITGFPLEAGQRDLTAIGFMTFLVKPVRIEDLHRLISEFNL